MWWLADNYYINKLSWLVRIYRDKPIITYFFTVIFILLLFYFSAVLCDLFSLCLPRSEAYRGFSAFKFLLLRWKLRQFILRLKLCKILILKHGSGVLKLKNQGSKFQILDSRFLISNFLPSNFNFHAAFCIEFNIPLTSSIFLYLPLTSSNFL